MRNFGLIIILSLILSSCMALLSEEAEEETINDLDGTWKTACYTNSDNSTNIDTWTFVGNLLTIKDQRYSDTACATVYKSEEYPLTLSYGDEVTFMSGNTGRYFKVTIGSTYKITPQSASAVSDLNSSSKCGFSNWELNTAKNCALADAGVTIYGLYMLVENRFYVNLDEDSYPNAVNMNSASSTFTKY